ncbi:fungal-specific transcription factor domain-containing protein [Dichotomocladium elegans]|nr:fungal-specific transcription factor domain-containing protein [Dichotomocladium elegans]
MEELLINLVDSGKSLPEGCQDLLGKGTTNNSDIDGGTGLDEKTESNNRKVESIERKDHAHDSTSLAPSQSKKTSVETFRNSNSVSVEPAHGPVYSYFGGSSGVYFLAKFLGEDNSTVVPVTDDDVMISDRTSHFDQCASGQPILWRFPDKEIVDRLVNIYFERMNTLLPVIDEDEFKANYQKDMDSIWPPLLAAMCRAGSRLLEEDDSMLKKHNIGRNDLFHMFSKQIESNKTRVDILSPKIEFVQFLILLGNSTEKWGFNTQEWVVISMAAKMAQELGLHRASTGRRLSPRQAEQYRRLWWSAYSMDRWVSTAMGRPLSISDADCDVDFPAAEDGGHNYSFLVAITKLACILGDISRVLYSPRARTLWGENTKDADQICANFQRKLEEWRFSLPPHLRIYPDDEEQLRIGQLPAELEQRVNSGAGHLLAAYYSTMILLKQRSHDIDQSFLATEASRATYFSAENIIYVLGALRPNTVLVFSSVTTSFALFQSVGIILVGLTDPNAELVSKSKELIQKFKIICSRFSAYLPQVR